MVSVIPFSEHAIPFAAIITALCLPPAHLGESGRVVVVFKEIIDLCVSGTFVLLAFSICFLCSGFGCLDWSIAAFEESSSAA